MESISTQKFNTLSWFVNPFIYVAGLKALIIGVILMLASVAIGFINRAHFDGVLDLHIGLEAPAYVFLIEVLVDWVSISVVLFIMGSILSKSKIRWIDVVGTQALARWPMLILVLLLFVPGFETLRTGTISISLIIFGIVSLLVIIWVVTLMFNAYKISCNLKGSKLIVSFVGGLISAEVISKVVIVKMVLVMMTQPALSETPNLPESKTTEPIELTANDLKKYIGIYSSPSFPLKVTITNDRDKLIGQATGQPSFTLECLEQDKFKFDKAGLILEFVPDENKMILKQAGQVFDLKKEP